MDLGQTKPWRSGLLAVGETVLALLAAGVLTLVLSTVVLAVTAVSYTLSIPIEATDRTAVDPEQVADRLRALGAAEEVRVDLEDGEPEWVLSGVESLGETSDTVRGVLGAAGYSAPERFHTRTTVEFARVLKRSGRLLLSLQALVFVAVAAGLVLFRVRPETPVARTGAQGAVVWGVLGGLVAFAGSALVGLTLERVGFPVEEQAWVLELFQDSETVWKLAPWLVFFVPLSEEVFFRGYMLRFLDQRTGRVAAVIVSSALFAVIHLNPSGIVVYFIIGLVLAFLYLRTGRLWAPILAHMVHNGVVFTIGVLGYST